MKTINNKLIYKMLLVLLMFLGTISCDDLTETNVSPNSLDADAINANFVMSELITKSAYDISYDLYRHGTAGGAIQYMQRDYIEADVTNFFQWRQKGFAEHTRNLTNAQYLINRSGEGGADADFLTGISLIMKSFWFGYMTSGWGDIPYSEAIQAEDGIFQPVYDAQKDIFKGILDDLERANDLLSSATVGSGAQGADPMFGGDTMKWRQFANSLQLRFLLRLSEKTADMSAIGVDVEAKFSAIVTNSGKYPLILSSSDNASLDFPGTSRSDSWIGGPNNWGNRSEFYRRKPCSTLVSSLRDSEDPRLTVWIRPVDVPIVEDAGAAGGDEIRKDGDGKLRRYVSDVTGLDTELYVGLPPALPSVDGWNKNSPAAISEMKVLDDSGIYFDSASNPHTSYLADIYQENSHPLVKSVLISSAEVNFILSEAVFRGWISGDALEFYSNGITESLNQYEIIDGEMKVYDVATQQIVAFNLSTFITSAENEYNVASDKLEPIQTQRWLANWLTADSWFSWRRTGYPDFGSNLVAGPNGDKIPVRYAYSDGDSSLNSENAAAALSKLSPSVNDQWSKMWLLQ